MSGVGGWGGENAQRTLYGLAASPFHWKPAAEPHGESQAHSEVTLWLLGEGQASMPCNKTHGGQLHAWLHLLHKPA